MIGLFKEATRQRGQSMMLYEDPDLGSIPQSEQQLIKALNEKLKMDS